MSSRSGYLNSKLSNGIKDTSICKAVWFRSKAKSNAVKNLKIHITYQSATSGWQQSDLTQNGGFTAGYSFNKGRGDWRSILNKDEASCNQNYQQSINITTNNHSVLTQGSSCIAGGSGIVHKKNKKLTRHNSEDK